MTKARSNATAPAAKGEIVAGTGSELSGILSVGTNGQVLTANSATTTGLEWATPAAGAYTLLSTTSMSGSFTVSISSISQSYKHLYVVINGFNPGGVNQSFTWRLNNDTTSVYWQGNPASNDSASATSFDMTNGVTLNSGQNQTNNIVQMFIPRYSNSEVHMVHWTGNFIANASNTDRNIINLVGIYNSSSAINRIDFITSPSAWSAGTINVYGVN